MSFNRKFTNKSKIKIGGGVSACKLNKRVAFILSLIGTAVLCCALLLSFFGGANHQNNLGAEAASTANAYMVKNGAELYNSATNTIDEEAMAEFIAKVLGQNDNKGYIGDLYDYIEKNGEDKFGSKVITSPTLVSRAGGKSTGFIMYINNYNLVVTSLTNAQDANGNNIVVATLMRLASDNEVKFNTSASDTNLSNAPADMYGTSRVRAWLNNESVYKTAFGGNFANKYLIQPKYIQYQHTQNGAQVYSSATCKNEALDDLGDASYQGGAAFNYSGKPGYANWGDDYFWLPSLAETGAGNMSAANRLKTVWNLNDDQLQSPNGFGYWLRSADNDATYSKVKYMNTNGACTTVDVTAGGGYVRPCMHLNLTAAAGYHPRETSDTLSADYNAAKHTLTTYMAAQTNKPAWYNDSLYSDASKMTVTYPTDGIQNAGDYWIKLELNSAFVSAQNALGINVSFQGTANTSDAAHMESATVRWIKFTVKKVKVGLKNPFSVESSGLPPSSSPVELDTSKISSVDLNDPKLKPEIAIYYTGGALTAETTTRPLAAGTYTATVKIKNADDVNYELDKTYSYTYTKTKEKATVPTIGTTAASVTYDGTAKTFDVQNYDTDLMSVSLPSGITYDSATGKFEATEVGEYKLDFTLKDSAIYDWDDTTGGTGLRSVTITVKPIQLTVTLTKTPAGAWSWSSGDTVSIAITVSGVLSGEALDMKVHYVNTSSQAKEKTSTVTGNCSGQVLEDASDLAKGNYQIVAELDGTKADNKHYSVSESTVLPQSFAVGASQVTLTTVTWKYTRTTGDNKSGVMDKNNPEPGYTVKNGVITFVYGADNITVDIDTSVLPAGVTVYTTSPDTDYTNGYQNAMKKNAGSYKTKVLLKAPEGGVFADTQSETKEFEIEWEIAKAEYDMSKVSWNYKAEDYVYTGKRQEVKLTGLPAGLTATYIDNYGTDAGENKTAKVDAFTSTDSNYILPDKTDAKYSCEWTIAKKTIEVKWTETASSDTGNNTILIPVLDTTDDASRVEYKYYSDAACTTEIEKSEIKLDPSNEQTFYVKVMLKQDNASVLKNFELKDESGNNCVKRFVVGANKNIVGVNVKGSGEAYDGSSKFEFEITHGTLSENDFVIKIAPKPAGGGEPAAGDFVELTEETKPVKAGEYVIKVELKGDVQEDNYLAGGTFNYTVKKGEFDLSNLVWVDETGEPYTGAFTHEAEYKWHYKTDENGDPVLDDNGEKIKEYDLDANGKKILVPAEHELKLVSRNPDPNGTEADNYPGKLIEDTDGTLYVLAPNGKDKIKLIVDKSKLTAEGAGTYSQTIRLDYDGDNYANPTENGFDTSFSWEIKKGVLDMTQVHWDYTGAFEFALDDEEKPVVYKVALAGLPDYLDSIVSYTQNENSAVGSYSAGYTFVGFDSDNYEEPLLPPGFLQTLSWEIKPRVFTVPPKDAVDIVFREEGYVFPEELELGEDWARYLTIEIEKDYKPYAGDASDAVTEKGVYVITIAIRSSAGLNNVQWSDGSGDAVKIAQYNLVPLTLTIREWSNPDKPSAQIVVEEDVDPAKYIDYRITRDALLADGGEIVDSASGFAVTYFIQAIVKTQFGENVVIALGDGAKDYVSFTTDRKPGAKEFDKPTLENESIVFNGEEITFVIKGFDEDFMTIVEGESELTQTNKGEYYVTIRFKKDVNAVWKETGATESVTLKFYITVLVLEVPTVDENALKYTGEEQTYLPNGFDGKYMTIIGNTGTDADTYVLTVGLKDPVNTMWKVTAENVGYKTSLGFKAPLADGEDEATSDKKLQWKINRAAIGTEWNTDGEIPKLILTDEEQSMVEYTYYDAKGNPVPVDKLKKGTEYRVQASLKDQYKQNYEFENAEVSYQLPMDGTFQFGGASGDFSFETLMTDWWWLILIAVLALLFLILLIVLLKRRKKKEEAVTAVAQAAPAEAPAPVPAQTAVEPVAPQQPMPTPERVYIQPNAPQPQMNGYGYQEGNMGMNPMLQQQMAAQQQMQMQQLQQQKMMQDMQSQKLIQELKEQQMLQRQLMMQLRAQQMQAQQQPVQPAPAPAPAPAAPAAPQVIIIDTDKKGR